MPGRLIISIGLAGSFILPAHAFAQDLLPSTPDVIAGDIAIVASGDGTLLIDQAGAVGIINWESFSIGPGNRVTFENGTGSTLNRVTGNTLSSIYGELGATGSVYLINENGVIFGETGIVRTGGDFVVSTLDISDGDFLDGGDSLFAGPADAYVINYGSIASLGGNVSLLARNVVNEGRIDAPSGTAALIAGREILMRDTSLYDGKFVVRLGADDATVLEKGTIQAAEVELRTNGGNVFALAGNRDGTISAKGVAKNDGRVFLTAGPKGDVTVAKTVKASTSSGAGGQIRVTGGNIDVSGLLDASSTVSKGGSVVLSADVEMAFSGEVLAFGGLAGLGGFAGISGTERLSFDGQVDTGGGTLVLDPNNFEITSTTPALAGASVLSPASIVTSLASNNLIIHTSGTDGEAGVILISEAVEYDSPFSLSLLAHGDIYANASILNSNGSGGDVNLVAGWDGSTSTASFNAAVFDALDLGTQTVFGNSNGSAYVIDYGGSVIVAPGLAASGRVIIGDGGQFTGVAIGARTGATRVYARDLLLNASAEIYGFSQLGYKANPFDPSTTATGDISIRATGQIEVWGGAGYQSYAQIGHVGALYSGEYILPTVAVDAAIQAEALGDVIVASGIASLAYAQIGHGSADPGAFSRIPGTRMGDISISTLGEISVSDGAGPSFEIISAWIGHVSPDADAVSGANLTLRAAAFDQDASVSVAPGGLGVFSNFLIESGLSGGNVVLVATDSGMALEMGGINTASDFDLLINAASDIDLSVEFSISSSGAGNVILAAGGNFHNPVGDFAFSMGTGRWLVYSTRPDSNTGDLGVLPSDFVYYGQTFDIADPQPAGFPAGNGLIYSVTPVVTVGSARITYGDTIPGVLVTATVEGNAINAADFGFTYDPAILDVAGVSYSSDLLANAGTHTGVFQSVIGSANVYGISNVSGDLIVDPALITVFLSEEVKTYDGIGGYTGVITYSGWVGSDDAGLVTAGPLFAYDGTDTSGVNAGVYTVLASGTAESSGNYIFDETDTALLTIQPALITVLLADEVKAYDGIGGYTGVITYSGWAGGDDAGLVTAGPLFAYDGTDTSGVNAGVYTVLASGTAESSGNYIFDETDTALLTIERQSSAASPVMEEGIPEIIEVFSVTPVETLTEAGDDTLRFISTSATDAILQELSAGTQFCTEIVQKEYVIDCLSDRLELVADSLPADGEYSDVKTALAVASRKLHALASQNASASMTRGLVRVPGADGFTSSRPLTPVESASLDLLNRQAAEIIEETQTILLRSAGNSQRRRVPFQRIAQAVGSNKVLFRSG